MKPLKLGIIGLSEGNGHPYSWSAIFNGYDPVHMAGCGFPVIPEYLEKQTFPDDFLTGAAAVTHVWTQDPELSRKIAHASRIPEITDRPEDMIGRVDAVLLARDDAENHPAMAAPFLEAGMPVFVDKPFALSLNDARNMLNSQRFDEQIFTCSSLRYASELQLGPDEKNAMGPVRFAEGIVMKKWDTYGIHLLEPVVAQLPGRGKLTDVHASRHGHIHIVVVQWENCTANFRVTGHIPAPLSLAFYGENGHAVKTFSDSFSCFKNSLAIFVEQIISRKMAIPRTETLELVEIIERGIC